MNKFQQSEQIGRTLLQSFLDQVGATDQQPTEDEYNPVDYYFTLKDKTVVAEIKVRDQQYESYPTHIMEVSKFQALEKERIEKQLDYAYYINFFGENTVYFYSTAAIKKYARQDSRYCKRTSAIYTGRKMKDVLLIPTDKAQKFIRINGKWQKYETTQN